MSNLFELTIYRIVKVAFLQKVAVNTAWAQDLPEVYILMMFHKLLVFLEV